MSHVFCALVMNSVALPDEACIRGPATQHRATDVDFNDIIHVTTGQSKCVMVISICRLFFGVSFGWDDVSAKNSCFRV